jgi:hypothetical protein
MIRLGKEVFFVVLFQCSWNECEMAVRVEVGVK